MSDLLLAEHLERVGILTNSRPRSEWVAVTTERPMFNVIWVIWEKED